MTILGIFLNKEVRTGGNMRYLELMEGLAEKGAQVLVIMNALLGYTPRFFSKIELPVPYKRARRGFPPKSFLFRRAVAKSLEGVIRPAIPQRPDWVHIHGEKHLSAALLLCRKTGASLFYASRLNDITCMQVLRKRGAMPARELLFSLLYERVCRRREKMIAKRARLIAFQGRNDRDLFCERTGADKAKTVIIPGNIGLPRCSEEWRDANKAASAGHLVFPGGLSAAKGLDATLHAFAAASKKTKKALSLSVLGRGTALEEERALKLAESLGIKGKVSFEGYVNPPFPFFAECGLVVYPTMQDAFPDTLLEALHCGCPAIASDIGDIADILPAECLFEAGSPEAASRLILRCVEDEGFYGRIRELCAKRAAAFRFDWAQKWLDAMGNFGA